MRARGKPTYTQHTVGWPRLNTPAGLIDEINVEFEASDDGVYGSGVSFKFHRFDHGWGGRETFGLEITGWGDGIPNLIDDRIRRVLTRIHKWHLRQKTYDHSPTPEQVVGWLEAEGIKPSRYHLREER